MTIRELSIVHVRLLGLLSISKGLAYVVQALFLLLYFNSNEEDLVELGEPVIDVVPNLAMASLFVVAGVFLWIASRWLSPLLSWGLGDSTSLPSEELGSPPNE